jgi:hypothetical protein
MTVNEQRAGITALLQLLQSLDAEFDDDGLGPEASQYRRLYQQALAQLVHADPTVGSRVEGLRQFDDVIPVEEAFRHAGFVQGFVLCSQWLSGTLNVPTVDEVRRGAR